MNFKRIALLTPVVVALGASANIQPAAGQASIPSEVRRRIAQAFWPQHLFNSDGMPEKGEVWRDFSPSYSALRIEGPRTLSSDSTIQIYRGFLDVDCSHCGWMVRAVARRDSVFLTLLDVGDLGYLFPWTSPALDLRDTNAVRGFVIEALQVSCLLGCGIREIDGTDVWLLDLPTLASPEGGQWVIPERSEHIYSETSRVVTVPAFAPSPGPFDPGSVYLVRVEFREGRTPEVSAKPIAVSTT